MKITPTLSNFKKWAHCVPTRGDLVFFDSLFMKSIKNPPFIILSTQEAREQAMQLWDLNSRSWYGYALNHVEACCWLPTGTIEHLEKKILQEIARCQIRLRIPSFVKTSALPLSLQKLAPHFGKHSWINAQTWLRLSAKDRSSVMRAWFEQNNVTCYESQSFADLPTEAQEELRRLTFTELLNSFTSYSGPNCMGFVAGAIQTPAMVANTQLWMHEKPFLAHLKRLNFAPQRTHDPQTGDVLVFTKAKQIVHAAYYLGGEIYMEKPGQDFYEPYRVSMFQNWHTEWPNTKMTLWRKSSN